MRNLFSNYVLNGRVFKNRIVMPPMVCPGWSDDNGFVSDMHVRHYEARARGGIGLIIVEACSVNKSGRAFNTQLGIWDDKHIEGLKRISDTCKNFGAHVVVQINHMGLKTHQSISDMALGPSECPALSNRTKAMTISEIHNLQKDYINAAERAYKAGYDGIELHGAHGMLLEQFLLPCINQRSDEYGGNLQNRLRFVGEIISNIRKKLGSEFILGYRMGCNIPGLHDGIEAAHTLEKLGIDMLHVSRGGLAALELQNPDLLKTRAFLTGETPDVPEGFNYNWIVFGASEIKRNVKIPLIAVNDIRTPERAEDILKNGFADFIAIGKDLLTDPDWANKAFERKEPRYCLRCKNCKRYIKPELCPLFY